MLSSHLDQHRSLGGLAGDFKRNAAVVVRSTSDSLSFSSESRPRRGFVVEELSHPAQLLGLKAEWDALQSRAGRLPFTSFEWNFAWWKHFARQGYGVRDHLAVRTVRNAQGDLVAVAPLMLTTVPARGPLRLRCLQFLGADPNLTEVRGPLVDRAHAAAVHRALFEHFESRRESWDWIRWSGAPANDALPVMSGGSPGVRREHLLAECIVELNSTWQAFLSSRSRNIKESLRRARNSLARAGLEPSFSVASTEETRARALREFLRLHAARATRTDTVRHADYFAAENSREFLSELCSTSSGMRIFTMNVGNRAVAARIGFVVGDCLYLYYSGYDPEYSRFNVMTHLIAESLKYAINEGLHRVNLSSGVDVSKTRWSPTILQTRTHFIPSRSTRGDLPLRAYDQLRAAVMTGRRVAARFAAK